jgi:Bcr/CflA subfamily drug resistance transporter
VKNSVSTGTLIWFAGLSMLGFLATDMYLPAFESIRLELESTQSMIGSSLSVFLLGMALGQILYGPLSDRIGRIALLGLGLGLFTLASGLCYMANSIEVLLFARFLQALGACSATVIWQAIVIDRYDTKTSQAVFATIMPLVALSPALAPLVGAGLDAHFGWRAIFIALVLLFTSLRQAESAPQTDNHTNFWMGLFADYKKLAQSRVFIGNMLIFSGCSAAFFAWLTGSPFIMNSMGYTGADIGLSYLPQTIAFIVGGYACRAWLKKADSHQILPWIVALFSINVSCIFILSFFGSFNSIIFVLIPFCFMAVANGAAYPIVVNNALAPFKQCSATAAGLLNFLQTLFCFLASGLVSYFTHHGLLSVSSVMFASALCVLAGWGVAYSSKKPCFKFKMQNT